MLQLTNITVSHGDRVLYKDVSLSLSGKDHKAIALLGTNGSGKSTLFRLMLEQEVPTSGSISTAREIVGYIPQDVTFSSEETVESYFLSLLDEDWMMYQVHIILEQLGIDEAILQSHCNLLSGGESMKIRIAAELIKEPTIMLFDEPTNHLDIQGKEWLGEFLKNFRGSTITVTHDRHFINTYMNTLWYIDPIRNSISPHTGNYDDFLVWKTAETERIMRTHENEERRKKELERWLMINEHSSKYRFSDIVYSKKRSLKTLENNCTQPVPIRKSLSLKDTTNIKKGTLIYLEITEHPQVTISSPLKVQIKTGEHLHISGANGTGKSTLLKMIVGKDTQGIYNLEISPGTSLVILGQHSSMNPKDTVRAAFEKLHGSSLSEPQLRSKLASFGYKGNDALTRVGSLSLGEQRKLELQILLLSNPDILILDEPTNHMDIDTREEIEAFLLELPIALVYVSHDQYFVDKVKYDTKIELG